MKNLAGVGYTLDQDMSSLSVLSQNLDLYKSQEYTLFTVLPAFDTC